jgi:hypothetical protein
MGDREAFEKWWPSVGQTIGKVAAWEAWQAAQTQTLLEVIRDTTGCPTKALQHSGEPVAWLCDAGDGENINATCSLTALADYKRFGRKITPLYTTPQPVVDVDAKREAESLAMSLWSKWHKDDSPDFELCDSVAGVITQISNMTTGLVRKDVSWGVDWGRSGDRSCVSIYKSFPDGSLEIVATEFSPYTTPQPVVDSRCMNPRLWTKEMSYAWCSNIPDLQKAFDALLSAGKENKNG